MHGKIHNHARFCRRLPRPEKKRGSDREIVRDYLGDGGCGQAGWAHVLSASAVSAVLVWRGHCGGALSSSMTLTHPFLFSTTIFSRVRSSRLFLLNKAHASSTVRAIAESLAHGIFRATDASGSPRTGYCAQHFHWVFPWFSPMACASIFPGVGSLRLNIRKRTP